MASEESSGDPVRCAITSRTNWSPFFAANLKLSISVEPWMTPATADGTAMACACSIVLFGSTSAISGTAPTVMLSGAEIPFGPNARTSRTPSGAFAVAVILARRDLLRSFSPTVATAMDLEEDSTVMAGGGAISATTDADRPASPLNTKPVTEFNPSPANFTSNVAPR